MATFVLVHGHYLGVWAWDGVVERLEAAGHRAIAASLTGMGERAGEASPAAGLATHVGDVVDLLERLDLRDVVLVGHSYAGMIIAGVAARVADRVRTLVFLDAIVARHGQRLIDFFPGGEGAIIASADDHGLIAPPDARSVGLNDDAALRANARFSGVPLGTFTEPLDAPGDPASRLPRHYVRCLGFALSAGIAEAVRAEGGWTIWELDTGHLPMLSHPEELAGLLSDLAVS